MNLLPNNNVPVADDPPLAQEPTSPPPPPPRASSSRHSSSPRPSSSSSTLERLGAIERDVAYIKQKQKKIKKTVNKMLGSNLMSKGEKKKRRAAYQWGSEVRKEEEIS
ncbi:hypothetical protein MRB53_030435 [Persea americana]|uniref:Uncharacterized protein n=1 Tax=Persea americana TaxID=3435 RepID=A0ACC2KLI3_PERAE|nr:hypothetical protein MRB53_030435 [Persea americana]